MADAEMLLSQLEKLGGLRESFLQAADSTFQSSPPRNLRR